MMVGQQEEFCLVRLRPFGSFLVTARIGQRDRPKRRQAEEGGSFLKKEPKTFDPLG
jgi:hypothetical protein